jgi:hypothetical protein
MPLKSGELPQNSPGTSLAKSNFPTSLRVLGTEFRVELAELEDDTAGDTDGLYRRIRISTDYDTVRMWRILVHEWTHAVLEVNGVSNVISTEVNEVIAQSMEHAIEELLSQIGPALMSQLSEKKGTE